MPTATALPTGTVVPFRTVAKNSAAGVRIGLIGPTSSDPFAKAVADSVVTQLETAGAALIRCDPGEDASLVLDCARRLTTQKVDGWIVVQAGNLGDALCAAGPAGVPLIAVGSAPMACETGWVGADDRRAGTQVGTALGRAAHASTDCADQTLVLVADSSAGPVSTARLDGIRAGFADQCPHATAEPKVLDGGTQDRAYKAFRTTLDTLPADSRVLVASVNDAAALGIAAAIPADHAETVTLAAVGGDHRARCEVAVNHAWLGDAALFPDRYGEVVVPALLDALDGRAVPPAMYVETRFLTAADFAGLYPNDECPAS